MSTTPEPLSAPRPQGNAASLVVELNNMRDALVLLALAARDYMFELESAHRNQAASEADQAIERAKILACQPRKLCDD
jgi:hypothetical protein